MATPPRAKHRGKRASGPSQHLNPGTVRPHNPWTTVRSGSDGATGGRAAITVALGAVVLAVAMLRYSMAPVRGPQQLADECDATMQALTAILDPLVDPDAAWAGATPLMRLDLEGSAAGQCLRRLVALGPDDVNGGAAPLHRVVAACAPSVDVAVTERCVDASSADIVDILETLAASMSRAADVLHVSIIVPRLAALSSAPQVQNSSLRALDVVVVGAGPVGLATALTAHAHGASVTVVEKRDDYTRDVWFDLTDLEVDGSASVETLRRWALHEFAPRVDDHRSEGVSGIVSIRCRELERFLSQVASAVGVDVIRGQELVQWSHACTSSVAAAHSLCRHAVHTARADGTRASSAGADASLHLPFDVAFVCDGAQSEGRRMLDAHVAFVGQHSLQPVDPALTDSQLEGAEHGNGQGGVITVPGLRQATLVAKLAPLPSGDCPALKRDTSGAAVDPFYPSFVIDGVTSVFKRFFSPYCEIQVLFSHVAAQRIRDRAAERAASSGATRADGTGERVTSDSDAFPWETLLAVARLVLDEPPAGLEQLRTMLLTTPDNGQPDATVFDIVINKVSDNTVVLPPRTIGTDDAAVGQSGVVMFRGDAAVTAHYRLGIGVNNALNALGEVASVVAAGMAAKQSREPPVTHHDWESVSRSASSQAQQRIDDVVQTQLHAMWHEAYCDSITYKGEVFRRARESRTFEPLTSAEVADASYCARASV